MAGDAITPLPRPAGAAGLHGLKVVVTGGLGALGRATGEVLAAQGAQVLLMDRAPAPAGAGAAVLGGVDLTDPAATAAAMQAAAQRLGGLDALVAVAGGFAWEPLDGGNIETWDRMYAVNLRTAVVAVQAALPLLLASPRGAVVFVGAMATARAAAGMAAYTASKSGVARLTEALADEMKDRGVRVNAVLPSTLDTPANRADMPDADPSRWVAPAALAEVVAFLLSDAARAVRGACIPVAGRM
jgi:NAD(P)-dependent dehydrogenase (short-subunit alcohol dehydrogenase family)